jgi:hypothetical protein
VGDNESTTTKNAGTLLAVSIAMQIRRYDVGCIARWSTSRASIEAIECRHWASAHIALPRRPSWSTILVENTKHKQNTIFT